MVLKISRIFGFALAAISLHKNLGQVFLFASAVIGCAQDELINSITVYKVVERVGPENLELATSILFVPVAGLSCLTIFVAGLIINDLTPRSAITLILVVIAGLVLCTVGYGLAGYFDSKYPFKKKQKK